MPDGCVLEGMMAIGAAIKAKSRAVDIVYIDSEKVKKRDRKVLAFLSVLSDGGIKYELCRRETIDAFLESSDGAGSTHGGVVAFCGERVYDDLDTVLERAKNDRGFIVVLDGIEDPYNFGYCVRCLYASGVSGIFIPQRNWMSASGVCSRSSAGASELCSMSLLPDFSSDDEKAKFIKKLRSSGFSVICAAATKESTGLFETEINMPAVIFIGGEKRGISPVYVENADKVVRIPYDSDAKFSLPTASTAAVFGFELERRKLMDKE